MHTYLRNDLTPNTTACFCCFFLRFFKQLPELTEADLLIVAGTSLQVSPANSVVNEVSDKCVRLIVNKEPVGEMLGVRYGEAAVQDAWDFFINVFNCG